MTSTVVNSTVPCSTGISRFWIAVVARRPMPGMAKMLSVITAPDSMPENCNAIMVMTGSMEFLSA